MLLINVSERKCYIVVKTSFMVEVNIPPSLIILAISEDANDKRKSVEESCKVKKDI